MLLYKTWQSAANLSGFVALAKPSGINIKVKKKEALPQNWAGDGCQSEKILYNNGWNAVKNLTL